MGDVSTLLPSEHGQPHLKGACKKGKSQCVEFWMVRQANAITAQLPENFEDGLRVLSAARLLWLEMHRIAEEAVSIDT
jgi:hypothetical protein